MNHSDQSASNSKPEKKKKSHPFWQFFWLSFLVLSLAYAWYSFYVPPNNIDWKDNIVTAKQEANESDKNMLLFFTGDWCVPCKIMKREIFADDNVAKDINSKLVSVLIDIDDPKWSDLVKQYNAGITPITMFTDHEGNVLDYAVGKINKSEFLKMFDNLDSAGS